MQPFSLEDTAVILIDHQVGTNTWAATTPLELLQRNVIILALILMRELINPEVNFFIQTGLEEVELLLPVHTMHK